jgi:hypothetical protein
MNYTLSTTTALTTMRVFVQYDGSLDRTSNNFPDIIETVTIMEAVICYWTAIFNERYIYTYQKFRALTTICAHVLSECSVD